MNYTPNDIQNLEFKRSMRGFDEDMVNDVLDKIIEDYSNYIHENIELKDRIGVLSEGIQHYKNIEDSLQETLVIAQQTSEEIKKNAQEKADLIIREAELRARGVLNDASKDSTKAKFQYDEIKNKMYMFKIRTESLLVSQLEMLKQMFDEDEDPVKQAVKNSEKAKEKEETKKEETKKVSSDTKVLKKIQEIDENENIEITEVIERD